MLNTPPLSPPTALHKLLRYLFRRMTCDNCTALQHHACRKHSATANCWVDKKWAPSRCASCIRFVGLAFSQAGTANEDKWASFAGYLKQTESKKVGTVFYLLFSFVLCLFLDYFAMYGLAFCCPFVLAISNCSSFCRTETSFGRRSMTGAGSWPLSRRSCRKMFGATGQCAKFANGEHNSLCLILPNYSFMFCLTRSKLLGTYESSSTGPEPPVTLRGPSSTWRGWWTRQASRPSPGTGDCLRRTCCHPVAALSLAALRSSQWSWCRLRCQRCRLRSR